MDSTFRRFFACCTKHKSIPALASGAFVLAGALGWSLWYSLQTLHTSQPVVLNIPHASVPLNTSPATNKPLTSNKIDRSGALALIPPQGAAGAGDFKDVGAQIPKEIATAAAAVNPPLVDPILLVRAGHPSDPNVANWLAAWRGAAVVGRTLDEQDRRQLALELEKSPLSHTVLFELGSTFADISADSSTASVFCAAAVARADKALRQYPPGSAEAAPILTEMNNSRRLLWDAVDNRQDKDAVQTLAVINSDLAEWVGKDDSALKDARLHATIGVPECLYIQGRVKEAIPLLLALDTGEMTDNEKLGVAWIRGLALLRGGRAAESIPYFQSVSKVASYQYAESAHLRLVQAMSCLDDLAGAKGISAKCNAIYGNDAVTHVIGEVVDTLELADNLHMQSPIAFAADGAQ